MNIRDGEVPTPRPGSLLKKQKANDRLRRLGQANAPVNTLDHGKPSKSSSFYVEIPQHPPTSKSRPIPTSSIDDDLRPSKRLRTTLDLSDVSPNPQTKASVDTESQEASSTVSLTGRSPDSKLQLRQSEYRSVAVVASSRTRKRRMRRLRTRRSQGPESIDDSDRSSIISVSPNPASLDELRNDATPTPKRVGPASRAAPDIKGHAQRPPRDDISEDELAIGGVGRMVLPTKAKGALSKDGLGTSPRAVAKGLSAISLCRAASGSQVHEPDEKFAFAPQPGNEKVWQAITLAGGSLHLPWLRVGLAKILQVMHGSTGGRNLIIRRPQTASLANGAPQLVLEFSSDDDCRKFVQLLQGSTVNVTMKFVQKEPDWMESASCKLFEAARRGARLEAQNQQEKELEESKATSCPSDEKALPAEEPGNKPLTKSRSLPTDKAPSSSKLYTLPFKPLSDLGVRRSTRATPGFQRLRSREPSPPQWSKANRAWERSWDHSLVYPRTGRDRATVDKDDIQRLDEGEFLNDNLILCYLRYLQLRTEADNPAISSRIYFMNTYFFETLKQGKGSSINYDGVKKWTSKVDLFSYDYIVVPVNENAHWYLLIVCNPYKLLPAALQPQVPETSSLETDNARDRLPDTPSEEPFFVLKDGEKESTQGEPPASDSQEMNSKNPGESTPSKGRRKSHKYHAPPVRKYDPQDARIISLDSLGTAHSPACRMLREYLLEEIKFRKNMEPPQPGPIGMTAKNIPQQSNFCDCGVFLLGYVEHFLANPDTFISTLLQKEKPMWSVDPSKLRVQIRETIFDLHRQQKVELSLENEKKRQDKKRRNASLTSKASLDECSIERNPPTPKSKTPVKVALSAGPSPSQSPMPRPTAEGSPGGKEDLKISPKPSGSSSAAEQAPAACLAIGLDGGKEPDTTPPPTADMPEKTFSGNQDVLPSVEDEGLETPSTGDDSVSSNEPGLRSAHFVADDQLCLSPMARSPPDAALYPKVSPEPTKTVQQSIETPDEVMGDDPVFINTIPSSPHSRRGDVTSPQKRKFRVIEITGDDEHPTMPREPKSEPRTRSRYFTSSDVDRYPVYVPRRSSGGAVRVSVEGDDGSPNPRRKRMKTIDLTD